MAGMTTAFGDPWLLTVLALLPPLAASLVLAWRGATAGRFVAIQLAGSVTLLILALMSFAFDQASSIDLAVTFGVLTLPASLLYAVVLERWV